MANPRPPRPPQLGRRAPHRLHRLPDYTGYGLRCGELDRHPYCFCTACREKYAEDRNRDLVDDAADPARIAEVREWQTEVSTLSIEYLRHRTAETRRALRLLARTQPQWRWNFDDTGPLMHEPYCMEWNRLLNSGVIEEIIIDHDDEDAPELFGNRLVADLSELDQDALVLPSIRAEKPDDLEFPLAAIRRYPVAGFVLDVKGRLTMDDARAIQSRYMSDPAQMAEIDPLVSTAYLLRRVQNRHGDVEIVRDFIRDFLISSLKT
jgi:hypothetical protein